MWLWGPFFLNYISFPLKSYSHSSSGEITEEETYSNISELPFGWGWPFQYIAPDAVALKAATAPVMITALPVVATPVPMVASWPTLGLNILLIIAATLSLVYCSQKLLPRFSMISVFVVMTGFCLYFGLLPRVFNWLVRDWTSVIFDSLYFVPIAGVFVIKFAEKAEVEVSSIWRSMKPSKIMGAFRRREIDDTPDDALATAAKLDQSGRWDEAIEIYRDVVLKWPEQTEYVDNCLAAIEFKKATGN